jgi:hypothetical protein
MSNVKIFDLPSRPALVTDELEVQGTGDGASAKVTAGSLVALGATLPGPTGPQGQVGYSGYSGISGSTGASGTSGISGYSGKSGFSGVGFSGYSGIGLPGPTGPRGYSGLSGISGYSGNPSALYVEPLTIGGNLITTIGGDVLFNLKD